MWKKTLLKQVHKKYKYKYSMNLILSSYAILKIFCKKVQSGILLMCLFIFFLIIPSAPIIIGITVILRSHIFFIFKFKILIFTYFIIFFRTYIFIRWHCHIYEKVIFAWHLYWLGLFYAKWLGTFVHYTFMLTVFVVFFFGTQSYEIGIIFKQICLTPEWTLTRKVRE